MVLTLRFVACDCPVSTSSLAPAGKHAYIPGEYTKLPQVFMENVVLIVHLILALGLIAVVLLQRSEGGGLGMGGGGGGAMTGRAAATALGKLTWVLATAFIITSITLTILAAEKAAGTSVIDRLGTSAPAEPEAATPDTPLGTDLLPPAEGDNAPLVPKAD
jgi:preprotein translocase subunit SecG